MTDTETISTDWHCDFRTTGRSGAEAFASAGWTCRPRGGLPTGDGLVELGPGGLLVRPTGTDTDTGQPAFAVTAAQDDDGSGWDDHIKWAAFATPRGRGDGPGFAVPAEGALHLSAQLSAARTGAERHPFGAAVADPAADPRIGAAGFIAFDAVTHVVAGFALTDTAIFALYERPPAAEHGYAAFSYAVPVAARRPADWHDLAVVIDLHGARIRWLVEGEQALATDRPGLLTFDRAHLLLDHGGHPQQVRLSRLACGLTLFTLLDGTGPDGRGLVRLVDRPGYYRSSDGGVQRFVDERSRPENRLWGQGVALGVRRVDITTEAI